MKLSSLNHHTIKPLLLGKIKWRIKFCCHKPGTILTLNLTTLMEGKSTHLNTVKIKYFIFLSELSPDSLWRLACTFYSTITTGTYKAVCPKLTLENTGVIASDQNKN